MWWKIEQTMSSGRRAEIEGRALRATCPALSGLLASALILVSVPASGQDSRPRSPGPDVLPDLEQPVEDGGDDSGRDRPWIDRDVPLAQRQEARGIFLQATELLRDGLYVEAEERYLKALALLEHPGIRYNLAIAQLNLKGKPIESYRNFARAMAFGPRPLGDDKYEQARNYRAVLENQLVKLEVACPVEGAEVTLNGKQLFTGPGTHSDLVVVGEYSIVASKPGFAPDSQRQVLTAGETVQVMVRPRPISSEPLPPRWPQWKPWAVAAAGGVVVLGGGVLHVASSQRFDEFDRRFRELPCAVSELPEGERSVDGCESGEQGVDAELAAVRVRARRERVAAFVAYGVGGVTVAAGLALVMLNQPRSVVRESMGVESGSVSLTVDPIVDPAGGRVGFTATLRF